MQTISSKTQDEIIPVSFDFGALIASIDSVQSVGVTVLLGEDAAAGAMLYNSPVITGAVCTQTVRYGIVGNSYAISVLVNSGVLKYELTAAISVQEFT